MGIVTHEHEGKTVYLVWSTVCDAPATWGLTREELLAYWRDEHGRRGLEDLERTLAHRHVTPLVEMLSCNRAGADEQRLSLAEIVDYYIIRRGEGPQPPLEPECSTCAAIRENYGEDSVRAPTGWHQPDCPETNGHPERIFEQHYWPGQAR